MSLSMTEKLKAANAIRERDVLAPIGSDVLLQYPVKEIQEMLIKTREGNTHIYFFTPLKTRFSDSLFINIHGGGFIKGRFEKDELFCRKLVNQVGCAVIDIDYKVAPEYMFPCALHECYDVVKWAVENAKSLGINKDKIAVGGHSAGGTLAAGVTMMAKQSQEFSIVCQILDYPPLDLFSDPSTKRTPPGDIIPYEKARLYNDMYVKPEDRKNPLASPMYASIEQLKGLPPALVITAGLDSLCDEGEKYASMLIEAGVEVTATRFLHSIHGFTITRKQGHKESEDMIFGTLKRHLGIE